MSSIGWPDDGMGGLPGVAVSMGLDKLLPPAPQIGHFAVGILGPMQSFDPAHDPVAF